MKRPVHCPCGKETSISSSSSMKECMASTDFVNYMNQQNGLEHVWICPACDARVRSALAVVREVFGELAEYIYLANRIPAASPPSSTDSKEK